MNARKPKSRVATPKPEPGKVSVQVFEELRRELGRSLTNEETCKIINLAKQVCSEGENCGLEMHYLEFIEAVHEVKRRLR
jgi:hypothetical protein